MDAPNGELFLKKPKEVKLIGYDYSFTDCLFKLIVENNTLKLKTYNGNHLYRKDTENITTERLHSEFIPLREFLEESTYVGRIAYRTKPNIHGDASYMLDVNGTKDTYLLYKGETHLILLEIEKDSGEETIQVLNGSFVDDAWEYNGPVKDTYRNTNDMYSAIQNKLSMGDLKLEELKRKKEEMDEIMRKRSIQRGPKIENARISRSK